MLSPLAETGYFEELRLQELGFEEFLTSILPRISFVRRFLLQHRGLLKVSTNFFS